MSTRYAIAYHELQKPGYMNFGVLPDTASSLEEAKRLLQSRGEEALDELVSTEAANYAMTGNYVIQTDDDGESVAIIDPEGGLFEQRVIHIILTIQVIEV